MEAKLQRRVQRYGWDAAAEVYHATWRKNLSAAHDAMMRLARLQPDEAVLDVACGSGFLTFRAAQIVGDRGCIFAADMSGEMINLVQEQARTLGLGNVSTGRMSAESLSLSDNNFDVALCGLALMFIPEPLDALKEIRRTLKPGGRAVAAVWGERRNCAWADIFPIVDKLVESEVCPLFFALGSGVSLSDSFERAGLTPVETHRLSVLLEFDSEADVLAAIIDGGAVALAAKRFDADTRKKVEKEFLASIAVHRQGDGYRIPGEFVVTCGLK